MHLAYGPTLLLFSATLLFAFSPRSEASSSLADVLKSCGLRVKLDLSPVKEVVDQTFSRGTFSFADAEISSSTFPNISPNGWRESQKALSQIASAIGAESGPSKPAEVFALLSSLKIDFEPSKGLFGGKAPNSGEIDELFGELTSALKKFWAKPNLSEREYLDSLLAYSSFAHKNHVLIRDASGLRSNRFSSDMKSTLGSLYDNYMLGDGVRSFLHRNFPLNDDDFVDSATLRDADSFDFLGKSRRELPEAELAAAEAVNRLLRVGEFSDQVNDAVRRDTVVSLSSGSPVEGGVIEVARQRFAHSLQETKSYFHLLELSQEDLTLLGIKKETVRAGDHKKAVFTNSSTGATLTLPASLKARTQSYRRTQYPEMRPERVQQILEVFSGDEAAPTSIEVPFDEIVIDG